MSNCTKSLRGTRAMLLAFSVAGALLGFVITSQQHAAAYTTPYCKNWYPTGDTCLGPEHSLTGNVAGDDTGGGAYVCAIAQYPGGGYDGVWWCGNGQGIACYGGDQLLKGEIWNDSGIGIYMHGTEYYGEDCP